VKKTLTLFTIVLLMATEAYCQNYRQAAGLRLGAAGGITYRRLFGSDVAGEIMLVGQNHGTSLVFLFEKQKPAVLFDDLNLNFIYGAGAHIGGANEEYCNSQNSYDNNYYYHGYNTLQLGVDGFASFEYLIPRYPIALSLECKPYFEFFDNNNFGIHLFVIAFGARYTF
jgi:hypothetical protein